MAASTLGLPCAEVDQLVENAGLCWVISTHAAPMSPFQPDQLIVQCSQAHRVAMVVRMPDRLPDLSAQPGIESSVGSPLASVIVARHGASPLPCDVGDLIEIPIWIRVPDAGPGHDRWRRLHAHDALTAVLVLLRMSSPPALCIGSSHARERDDEKPQVK